MLENSWHIRTSWADLICINGLVIFSMLQVDNNGQEQIAEGTQIRDEGSRINLSSDIDDYSKVTSYITREGHNVSILILTFCNNILNFDSFSF